jgi:hypothetical protein
MDIEKIIQKVIDPTKNYLYVGGDLVVSDKSIKKIKEFVKSEFDPPKKNIKGFLIKVNIKNTCKIFMNVSVTQITITPKMFIGATDDDMFQIFTYSPDEMIKYGFKKGQLELMMNAIKNHLVSFEKNRITISELLKVKCI